MKTTVFFLIIVAVLILEKIYCIIALKHQKISKQHEEEGNAEPIKRGKVKKIISWIYSLAGDFTFLLFKVVGYIPCHMIRNFLYRHVFYMKIGKNCVIHFGMESRSPWNISIGEGTIIGDHAILDARYGIKIGCNVNLSSGVWIWTLQHDLNSTNFSVAGEGKCVEIGDRAWISSRTTILPGCQVKEGCVIAAGAVLTKSTEKPYLIYGGVPAKRIGERNNNISYIFNGKHRFFL